MTDQDEPRPLLERWGVSFFRTLSRGVSVVDTDGVHYLNADERAGLKRVVVAAVARAALAGTVSTLISATAEVLATPLLAAPAGEAAGLSMTARFWLIVLGITALASILEILYLYWDGLRAVHKMAMIAGLDLFGAPVDANDKQPSAAERSLVAEALARAALELPNPAGRVFGINPRRHASRAQLIVASIVYKLKISVTSFLVKALVRRALGRTALRGWLDALVPFAAVPVTAIWNAVVAWLVLREARIRTMGPSAAVLLSGHVLEGADSLTPDGRYAVLRSVACSIVRTEDLHPNLLALLHATSGALGVTPDEGLDDPDHFLRVLADLPQNDQTYVLRMLGSAAVLDGRITRKERRLLVDAFAACKREANLAAVERLRRAFVAGDRLEASLVQAIA